MIAIIISFATSLIAGVFYTEISARSPRITQSLLERAVSRLPNASRGRYREEWFAYLRDQPTPLSALLAAFGLLVAAERVRAPGGLIWTRALDRLIALQLIIVLGPLFAVITAIIRLLDGGPAIYAGEYAAPDGEVFYLRRFRTVPHTRGQGGWDEITSPPTTREYRMLRFGRFLRATGIDVLPELINVLLGDMSMVGPRPRSTRFQSLRADDNVQVRPGITGIRFLYSALPDDDLLEYFTASKKAEDRFREAMEDSAAAGIKMWLMGIRSMVLEAMRGPRP